MRCCQRDGCPPAGDQWRRSSKDRRSGGGVPAQGVCGGGGGALGAEEMRDWGGLGGRVGEARRGEAGFGGRCLAECRLMQIVFKGGWRHLELAASDRPRVPDIACRHDDGGGGQCR